MEHILNEFEHNNDMTMLETFNTVADNRLGSQTNGVETFTSTNVDRDNIDNVFDQQDENVSLLSLTAVNSPLMGNNINVHDKPNYSIFNKTNRGPIEPKIVELPLALPAVKPKSKGFTKGSVTNSNSVGLNNLHEHELDLPTNPTGSSLTNTLDLMVTMMNSTFKEIQLMSNSITDLARRRYSLNSSHRSQQMRIDELPDGGILVQAPPDGAGAFGTAEPSLQKMRADERSTLMSKHSVDFTKRDERVSIYTQRDFNHTPNIFREEGVLEGSGVQGTNDVSLDVHRIVHSEPAPQREFGCGHGFFERGRNSSMPQRTNRMDYTTALMEPDQLTAERYVNLMDRSCISNAGRYGRMKVPQLSSREHTAGRWLSPHYLALHKSSIF